MIHSLFIVNNTGYILILLKTNNYLELELVNLYYFSFIEKGIFLWKSTGKV